ncbi:MAG: XdhC family protein [Proteobacteria bacterium]|nr:XdhC family protein [Pseudomonadota bacterium]
MSTGFELSTLVEAMRDAARDGLPAALATITSTRGATFRRAGARMLVHADGRVACELSGGCPQRDIVQRALRVIASGHPELARYNAASGFDVLLEMGCGGELDVLIEPLVDSATEAFFDALLRVLESRRSAVAATVFAFDGKAVAPRRALWCDGETCFDELEDAALRDAVVHAMASVHTTRAVTLRLPAADGLADVLIERIDPPHALYAIGSNATARALLCAGHALGWRTTLIDADPVRLQEAALPHGTRTVQATPHTFCDAIALDRHSSAVVMTHNLAQDLAWLAALRDAPVAYLGAIGSRERAARMRRELSPPLADLHMPAGLDIGAETPAEIALAIIAEIVATLNARHGGSLRDSSSALHP